MTGRPGFVRAWASLRARPAALAATAVGLALVGVMIGAAVTLGLALTTGFDRAQRVARTADVIAHFDIVERDAATTRLSGLANVASTSYRYVLRGIGTWARPHKGESPRFTRGEVDGLEPGSGDDGVAILSGRRLSGRPGEVVVERGFANAWDLQPGDRLGLEAPGQFWRGTIVGIAIEPTTVAYPLASQPRVYIDEGEMRAVFPSRRASDPVNTAYLRVVNPDRLPETLVQARTASFGLSGTTYITRAGSRAAVDEAAGLIVALLVGFAVIAVAAAGAMLAAIGHARVTRDLPSIGALRAIGFGPWALACTYALEAGMVALPAAGLGIAVGSLLVWGPTGALLDALNEIGLAAPVVPLHLAALAAIVAVAMAAAGWPALAAGRQTVAKTLTGAQRRYPRRIPGTGSPLVLGARLVARRPGRLLVSGAAVAMAFATILLLVSVGRFLLRAQREPVALGERYSLLVHGPADRAAVLDTRGVGAAVDRYQVNAVDAFGLQETITIVAFGPGAGRVFVGRPLQSGRRAAAPGEAEIGIGLAQSLGVARGGRLIAETEGGGEIRLTVSGVVQELSNDGRVAYTDAATLAAAVPGLVPDLAVRLGDGASVDRVRSALQAKGLDVATNAGVAPGGSSILGTIVALLRAVAALNGLVCAALVLLALVVLARERRETIGVLRAVGATRREITRLLLGAGLVLVGVALLVGYLVERYLFAPALTRLVERFGLPALTAAPADAGLLGVFGAAVALATASLVAWRTGREAVVELISSD